MKLTSIFYGIGVKRQVGSQKCPFRPNSNWDKRFTRPWKQI